MTIANEPNTVPGRGKPQNITPAGLGLTYRELDKQLTAKGLRTQIRFTGGDLIEGSRDPNSPFNQAKWFEHIAHNMQGVFDSLSAHVYWDYDATSRFEQRLDDVRDILNRLANMPHGDTLQSPMPVFITEFGTRSKDRAVKGVVDPGNFRVEQFGPPPHATEPRSAEPNKAIRTWGWGVADGKATGSTGDFNGACGVVPGGV